jgi:alpha-1,3-rhamnosyl/mannosyltransferase
MIDATALLLRSAGVKTYTYEWIRALRQSRSGEQVRLFPFLDFPPDYHHEHSPLAYLPTMLRIAALHFGNIPGNPAWNILGRNTDIFHCSNQCKNPPRNTLLTATIHDLTCWLMPEFHCRANVRADANYARRVLKRADGLIAVSENTRRDAIEVLKVPEDRITAIHPGVAPHFFDVPQDRIAQTRTELKLTKPYVLTLGTLEPRKNAERLLAAWTSMPHRLTREFDLVFAGPIGWASKTIQTALRSGRDGIRYLGYVNEANLPGLNAGATALVYPSLYEGFGFPVAQAMASGVPVVTSNVSSMPEVAGDTAVYADPKDPESIAAALGKVLDSESLRRELGVRGRQRAENFRWEITAEKTWQFWQQFAR